MIFKDTKKRFVPAKGNLLISEPFLNDPNFRRTVVLLGEHGEEGTVGFVLNRMLEISINDVVPGLLDHDFPVYYGGPVEQNTLHFIHSAGLIIPESQEICDGIYWGGDIDLVNDLLLQKIVKPEEFRFFIGYSGWAPDQLINEVEMKAWWVTPANESIVFSEFDEMWKRVVKQLGQDFAHMANSPEDPTFN